VKVSDKPRDLLFAINTVYFYKDPLKVFQEMYRVVSEDGTLIIGKRSKEDLDLLSNITDHEFNKLSCEQVEAFARDAGFSNVHSKVFEDHKKVEFPAGGSVNLHAEFIIGTKAS